jgi:hypothetical protein
MDELDDLEINLRDVDDVGCRIVLLTALTIWPDHETLDDRDSWVKWLERQNVLAEATRAELTVFNDHRERELVESDLTTCGRAFDALQALAWSVALTDDIALVLRDDGSADLLETIPIPGDSVENFLDGLMQRDENEIALERERAEVWNWRFAAEISRRESSGRNKRELEDAISEVVLECAATMVIAENDGRDFQVDGVPVRDLTLEIVGSLLVASEEHLRALNWVCGLTEWTEIHLPD